MITNLTRNLIPAVSNLARSFIQQNKINSYAGTRLLQGLPLIRSPAHSPIKHPRNNSQGQRGIVTQATLESLNKNTTVKSIGKHFSYQESQQDAITNIRALQRKTLHPHSFESLPAITTKSNPTTHDVERIVRDHGPASLTLRGLTPHRGDVRSAPTEHTVLVIGTFRDEHGSAYAVVADGDHLAKNPVTEFADAYAKQHGKSLQELDQADRQSISSQLQKSGKNVTFDQAIYRLINLDRAFEAHDAITTRHQNFLTELQKNFETDGEDIPEQYFKAQNSEIGYFEKSSGEGQMPHDVTQELLSQIKNDPSTVEPFIPLMGPAAVTDLFIQVPAVAEVFKANSVAGKWKPLESVAELKNCLMQEPTFQAAVEKPENQAWLTQLYKKINAIKMPAGHRGIELPLQFPVTYGHVAHIGPMSLWRDDKDHLQMALLHQEAIPIKGAVWEGQVYTTFDTAKEYPTGRAPVLESIKFTGMPNVTQVRSVKYPDKLALLAEAMSGPDNAYPYGGTPRWHGDKGRFPEERPFNSCSNTSYEAHKIMMGEYPIYKSTVPELWQSEIGEIYNIDQKKIAKAKVGGQEYGIEEMLDLPFEIVGAMWPQITLNSASLPCDVPATYITQQHKKPLPVGTNQPLPADFFPEKYHGVMFINPKGLIASDGAAIERNVHYTPEQVSEIVFSNDNPKKKLDFWIAIDNPTSRE